MELETENRCDLCDSSAVSSIDSECNICRCETCGFMFDSPRPTVEELARFYSQPTKYEHWLSEEILRDELWQRRLKKMSKHCKHGTLLDVGTGIGQFLHHAQTQFRQVYGTELSDSAIGLAQVKYGLELIKGEIETIQFDDAPFDNITMFHLLEHVPSPKRTIERCWELLSDDGLLFIAVPNDVASFKAKLKIWLKRLGIRKFGNVGRLGLPKIALDGSLEEIHLSHFTPTVLQTVLERSGFTVVDNSLDPYYAAGGLKKIIYDLFRFSCTLLHFFTGVNIYDTIWIVARKSNNN